MTSILNNAGAMIALSTLSETNRNLLDTQTQISTGKRVDNASQDAAIWAVTTVMEADIDGFNAISDALSLGKATVTVARNASEKVTDLLREMKEKIVTAQGENVDRGKVQTDIDELKNQIGSIVSAAQFNGLNLIDGSRPAGFDVISSLDRTDTGVETARIKVDAQDLSTGSASAGTGAAITIAAEDSETNAAHAFAGANASLTVTVTGATTSAGAFELFVDGVSVGSTVSIESGATAVEAGSAIFGYINGLGRDDIEVSTAGGGDVVISSSQKFDTLDVELREVSSVGVAVTNADTETTLTPGVSSVVTKSSDTTDETTGNAGFAIHFDAVNANGDVTLSINGIDLTNYNVNSANLVPETDGLASHINAEVANNADLAGKITAISDGTDTVRLVNNSGENFDIEVGIDGNGATDIELFSANTGAIGRVTAGDLVGSANTTGNVLSGTLEGKGADIDIGSAATPTEGDSYTVFLREGSDGAVGEFTYVAKSGDDENDVAQGLEALIAADDRFDVFVKAYTDVNNANNALLRVDSTGSQDVYVAVSAAADGTAGGGLSALSSINVTTASGAASALDTIEDLIQTSVDAASAFGSTEKRLDIQADFVDSLIDSFKGGVGGLVDTNMEEASARLQALQVQQQLGSQALSIANAAPQSVLALFR